MDLGVAEGVRVEWDAYDLRTRSGIKVEVKSAAYIQSWAQTRPSTITFDVRATIGWDAATNTTGTMRQRQADVDVFALVAHQERTTIDPLDVDQWKFYVLATDVLNIVLPKARQAGLSTLLGLGPETVSFGSIAAAVERLEPHGRMDNT